MTLPSKLTLILAAVAGVIVAFVQSNIIVLEGPWHEGVTYGLTVIALFGISPLTGASFRAILHLTNGAAAAVAAVLAALQVALTQFHMSAGLHGLLAGIIVFAAGLGFAPTVTSTVAERLRRDVLLR